jgi:hypothetical protein
MPLQKGIFIFSLQNCLKFLSPLNAGLLGLIYLRGDMTRIAIVPTLTLTSASSTDLEPARRFIVLVPALEADLTMVSRRIWELANAAEAHVQFIGLYNDTKQEPSLRRDLVTMSAMVNLGKVSAEAEVIFGRDWVHAVRSRWREGDMVVCFEEQRVGLSHKPLSQILQSDLNVPLFILSGLYPKSFTRPTWPSLAAAWLGSIAILLGFFLLQVQISNSANDWSTALQLLSVIVETWLIWAWNSLFG